MASFKNVIILLAVGSAYGKCKSTKINVTDILSELLKTPNLPAETDLKILEAQELLLDVQFT
jgi:hypothetical protein